MTAVAAKPRLFGRISFWPVVSTLALIFFAVFLIYPILNLLLSSLGGTEGNIFETYIDLLSKKYYYEGIINSFILTISATLLAVALGVPLAYLVSRYNIPGKLLIRAAIVLTFVSPPFIGAYAWVLLFGSNGVVTNLLGEIGIDAPGIYGWPGTILVLGLQGMPFVFLLVSAGLKSVDQSVEDAALNLGRRPLQVVFGVIFPLIIPAISTGALLAFVTAFTDFGTPSVIGQNLRVLPRLVYSEFINEHGGNFQIASALSTILLVVTIGALLIQRWFAKRRSFGQETVKPLGVRRLQGGRRTLATIVVYIIVGAAALPLVTVLITSFMKTENSVILPQFSVEGYLNTPRLWTSLLNTVTMSTAATIVCVIFGTLVAYVVARRRSRISGAIDVLSMTPYAVSGVVLGIALSMTFGGSPFFLAGTALILIIAYVIRRLPYSVRSSAGMLGQMGTQTEEASVNLGVPPGRTFLYITVPMITPAILSGALLTWATIVREFNTTIILYGSSTGTMAVEVFRHVMQGNFGAASVVGSVLIIASLIPIVILFKFMGKDEDFLV